MSTHEDITQGVRSWVKAGLGLTDSQILPFDAMFEKDFKEELPFLAVKVLAMPQIGRSESLQTFDAEEEDPLLAIKQFSRAPHSVTVDIFGYGLGAHEWMLEIHKMTESIEAQDALDAAFLSIVRMDDPSDLSEFLDTDMEMRFLMSIEFGITISGSKYAAVPLETIDVDMQLQKKPINETDEDSLVIDNEFELE